MHLVNYKNSKIENGLLSLHAIKKNYN